MKSINNISIISFAKETFSYVFNTNEKYIKWGADNKYPNEILKLYDSVPEHESAINFIETNLSGEGINSDEINIWTLKKIVLDYLLFGGFTIKIQKLKNKSYLYDYIDISKLRLSPDKDYVGYSENWDKMKVELTWYPLVKTNTEVDSEAVYYFKNNKSRECYPRPHYLSAFKSIETANAIASYHNNNARNGFRPNTIINFNNGVPDDETKKMIEDDIKAKFTGPDAQTFLCSFNDTSDNAVTLIKLDNDNLDQKFETLQKFIQNQIIITHQITSGQLIGVKAENQGFSKTEYDEAMTIFNDVVIKGFRNEFEFALTQLFNKEIKIIDSNNDNTNINNNA